MMYNKCFTLPFVFGGELSDYELMCKLAKQIQDLTNRVNGLAHESDLSLIYKKNTNTFNKSYFVNNTTPYNGKQLVDLGFVKPIIGDTQFCRDSAKIYRPHYIAIYDTDGIPVLTTEDSTVTGGKKGLYTWNSSTKIDQTFVNNFINENGTFTVLNYDGMFRPVEVVGYYTDGNQVNKIYTDEKVEGSVFVPVSFQ